MSGKDERFNMNYGTRALLTGWIVTFLVFCLGLTVVNVLTSGDQSSGWSLLPAALMFGFPVAVIVGLPLALPLALLLAWPLWRVRDQRLHVLVFALALGAAIGRAAVITMAARRNAQ